MSEAVDKLALHPRPNLVRDRWIDLCGAWKFGYDDDDVGLRDGWYGVAGGELDRTIRVPYPPESKLSGIHDPSFHPVAWYQRHFALPDLSKGTRLLLHFGAVDYHASVWLNGRHLADHEGGHTPFAVDITDALDPSVEQQSLVVRAADQPTDAAQPRGKQSWDREPSGIWYHRTTGIWQPVWLEPVPQTYVEDLALVSNLANGSVDVEVSLGGTPQPASMIEITVTLDGAMLAQQTVRVEGMSGRCTVNVPALTAGHGSRLWWSPESPTLVDVDVMLLAEGVTDRVSSYVGFREADVRDGAFTLNGRPYYLRMVLEQGYWPESHLAAPSAEALRREVELAKELGFTGVRVHQKVEDPRFLYWCDRLGLLVWGEMANAHAFSVDAAEKLAREWTAVIRRDRSHPCIVAWVPLNESWGVPDIATSPQQQHFATALYHLTKAQDPTRPVISNDGWEHTESDIWGIHDYDTLGAGLLERYGSTEAVERTLAGPGPSGRKLLLTDPQWSGQPIVITEFGGLSYLPDPGETWHGYRIVDSEDEFREGFGELVTALLDAPTVAGFCYTQLTDTAQERNGLLTEDRVPKLPVAVIHEIVTRPSSATPRERVRAQQQRARRAAEGTL